MSQKRSRPRKSVDEPSLPKYSIAVASDLAGISQQQLRRLEESGLVLPGRTDGNTRRYSDDDLSQVADVTELTDEGVNMVGVRRIIEMRAEIVALRQEVESLREQLAQQTSQPHPAPSAPHSTAKPKRARASL
jgi:MerR family transcriptional regulator/heat shock protein HspR